MIQKETPIKILFSILSVIWEYAKANIDKISYLVISFFLFVFFLISLFGCRKLDTSNGTFFLLLAASVFALIPSIKSLKVGEIEFKTKDSDVYLKSLNTQDKGNKESKNILLNADQSFLSSIPKNIELFSEHDPLKFQFSGTPVRNQIRLSAEIAPIQISGRTYHKVSLSVKSLNSKELLTGTVKFFLHPTFHQPIHETDIHYGEANYQVVAYEAFTVGAIVTESNGNVTYLELDLNSVNGGGEGFYA